MDITLFSILLSLGIVLLFLTFFKKQIILGVFAGVIFILLGLFSWSGINYVSSTIITQNNATTYTITDIYTPYTHYIVGRTMTYTSIIGTLLILFGLFLFLMTIYLIYTGKKSVEIDDTNNNNNEED